MQSVGTLLREARERKGLSMDDIIVRTRINIKNLTAIETDDVSKISSPFHYRSFVRQYAQELGVDFDKLSSSVELATRAMRQPDLPGQGEHPTVRVAPLQPRIKRDFSWMIPTAVLFAVIVLGSGGYAAWRYKPPLNLSPAALSAVFSPQPVSHALPAPAAETHAPGPPEAAPVSPAPSVTTVAVPAVSAAPVAAEEKTAPPPSSVPVSSIERQLTPESIHLELAATERTWLSISADGKQAYSGILEPEETKVLEGQQVAKLRTGNAGGVSVIFNGRPIGNLGPRGSTRTVIFTPSGYAIQPTETAKLTPVSRLGS